MIYKGLILYIIRNDIYMFKVLNIYFDNFYGVYFKLFDNIFEI